MIFYFLTKLRFIEYDIEMNRLYPISLYCILITLCFRVGFAQTDELNSLLSGLVYDPNKSYPVKSAVMISLDDGEIYTSNQEVPASADGRNGPNGSNASTYWSDSTTTTQKFEEDNPTFLAEIPSDINTTALSQAVADLTNPSVALPESGDSASLLLDISTAGFVSASAKMSGGFIIVGGTMEVLVTAKSSKEDGVDTLNNPRLEVVPLARDKIIGSNNNWKTGSQVNEITASGLMNGSGDNDAAVLLTLEPGAYLADVLSEDSDSGGALVEIFDMNAVNGVSNGSKLLDISTNGTVLSGTSPGQKMTAGFIIYSGTSKRVLVTAKGSIETGVDPLNNPRLEVVPLARDKVSGSNFDWKSNDSTQVDAITTIGYMNNFKDTDAALILTLDAGAYLVDVFSEDDDSGKALVEVFDVDMLVNEFGIIID